MEEVLPVLGTAVFFFVAIKAFFGLLAWLFPEADDLHRAKLDRFFDLLDRASIFEIGHKVLARIVGLARRFLRRRLRAYALIGSASLLLNAVIFFYGTAWVVDANNIFSSGLEILLDEVGQADPLQVAALLLLVGLLGTGFDLASLSVTLHLLARASASEKARSLVLHLAVDICVAGIACLWAYVIYEVVINAYYDEILARVKAYAGETKEEYGQYLGDTAWETLQVNRPLLYAIAVSYTHLTLPTNREAVQRALARVVYLITTDRQPVLKQVAVFASWAGGLLGALAGWLGSAA